MPFDTFGRTLLVIGLVIAAIGGLLVVLGNVPWLGRLPGDLSFGNDNFRIYIPIATSILLSIVLTVVLNLLARR